MIDLQTGEIKSTYAAHAKNTDCPGVRNGYACRFSENSDEGDLTPLGFFSTGGLYTGTRGSQIGLNGLEAPSGSFKGNSVASSALIHGADYVKNNRAGRSHGCPALNPTVMNEWKDQLKDGALFYFYHSSLDSMDRHPKLSGAIGPTCSAPAPYSAPGATTAPRGANQ
jgi:hypothetical protein